MRRSKSELLNDLPRGRLRLGRLAWVILAAACLAAVILPAGFILDRSSVASRHSFTGSLRPVAAPVSVILPEGAYLKEILVDRNERVYAGQTVALLDKGAISDRLTLLERRMLHDEALRACLLSDNALSLSEPPLTLEVHVPHAAIQEAETTCLEAHQMVWDRAKRFEDAMTLVEADQALLEKYVQVLFEETEGTPDARQENVLQILSLKVAQNRLAERKRELEEENLRAREARSLAHAERIAALDAALRASADQRRRLAELLKQPRLLAPESGQVIRLRRFPLGATAFEDTEFLEIRPADTQGYVASFPLPDEYRSTVVRGQAVWLDLLGMGPRAPRLQGRVSRIDLASDGVLTAFVDLQRASTLALDNPDNGIALRGESTAAVVYLQFGEFNALAKVQDSLAQAFAAPGFRSNQALNGPGAKAYTAQDGAGVQDQNTRMLATQVQ